MAQCIGYKDTAFTRSIGTATTLRSGERLVSAENTSMCSIVEVMPASVAIFRFTQCSPTVIASIATREAFGLATASRSL